MTRLEPAARRDAGAAAERGGREEGRRGDVITTRTAHSEALIVRGAGYEADCVSQVGKKGDVRVQARQLFLFSELLLFTKPAKVRKTPGWPRNWANSSLLQLCSHRSLWTNLHLLGQPDTFLAPAQGRRRQAHVRGPAAGAEGGARRPDARVALDVKVITTPPSIFH